MASEHTARFVWFWTFWHWSRESFRDGALLRDPLRGVAGHWQEWYRHEASADDREAILRVGQTETAQRRFMAWLLARWLSETDSRGNRPAARFLLGQLAGQEPFSAWAAFAKYRESYGVSGISAVVLAEQSDGQSSDVRVVEALALPETETAGGRRIVAESFEPDGDDLAHVQGAVTSLLQGRGLMAFWGLWVVAGLRPGGVRRRGTAAAGWIALGGMLGFLRFGPEPHDALWIVCASLGALWILLLTHAISVACLEGIRAWRAGKTLAGLFSRHEVRLRMSGGLHLQGASAGLAFGLNTLLALFRAGAGAGMRSWLWRRACGGLQREAPRWAATGVLTRTGWIKPVLLEPKLRACQRQALITDLFAPAQPEARQTAVDRVAGNMVRREKESLPLAGLRLGFAATTTLRIHRARHLSETMLALGRFFSPRQVALNVYAVTVSAVMILALPDLVAVVAPPAPPSVVGPASASPYYLWVSLDTDHPERFRVHFESEFWANRVAEVVPVGVPGIPPRAELHVQRLPDHLSVDQDNGIIWIERRRTFLGREFLPGQRVGHYPLSYVNRLSHE